MISRLAIIVQDEFARAQIRAAVSYSNLPLQIVAEPVDMEMSIQVLSSLKPDFIFLDAKWDSYTAFDILDRFEHQKFHTIILSPNGDYAVRAFRYHATDYLVYPLTTHTLIGAMHSAYELISMEMQVCPHAEVNCCKEYHQSEPMPLPANPGSPVLFPESIVTIECYGNYTFVYDTAGQRKFVHTTLKEFESMLPKDQFFRIHQSHCVFR